MGVATLLSIFHRFRSSTSSFIIVTVRTNTSGATYVNRKPTCPRVRAKHAQRKATAVGIVPTPPALPQHHTWYASHEFIFSALASRIPHVEVV